MDLAVIAHSLLITRKPFFWSVNNFKFGRRCLADNDLVIDALRLAGMASDAVFGAGNDNLAIYFVKDIDRA